MKNKKHDVKMDELLFILGLGFSGISFGLDVKPMGFYLLAHTILVYGIYLSVYHLRELFRG